MTTLLSSIPGIGYYFLPADQRMQYDLEQCAQKALLNGFSQSSDRADHLVKEARRQFSDKPQVVQASDELVWLREVSKYPELMKAERLPNGKFGLKILPKALDLLKHEFNTHFFGFVKGWNYPVIFENRVYTSKAVMVALEQGKLSSPKEFIQVVECSFRDGKKSTWTAAQIKSLGLEPDINLSDVEESLFGLAYEAFVDCQDRVWWNQRTHEEVFRLRGFVERFMTERRVEIPEFTLGNNDIITIGEDRLLLTPDRFQQDIRDFLKAYPYCHFIRIEQSQEKYPLVFRRLLFVKLVEAKIDPALIQKKYTFKTQQEITSVTSDIYFQFFSRGNIHNAIRVAQQNRYFEVGVFKQTLDDAIQYLKTDIFPLTWEDIRKLRAFLNEYAHDSVWTQNLNQAFKDFEPHFSKKAFESFTWKDLEHFILNLNESYVFYAGPNAYSIRTIKILAKKSPDISPALLAQPVWFLVRGEKVQADLSLLQFYPEVLKKYPTQGTGELSNPIQFPETESFFNENNINPFISFFRMLQSLRVFLQNQPKALAFLDVRLHECSTIYIGNQNKKGRDYWIQVREELTKYPKASEVILDGCSQKWKRSVIEVFCDEGTLTVEDLNTAVLLKFSAVSTLVGRYEPVYHQISLAEWKCLSSCDPSIDRSGRSDPSERILFGDFTDVYAQVFTREKKKLSTDLHPFLKLLTPFALQQIDPNLVPPARIFSAENSLFYAQRVLAIFTAAIGWYLSTKSSSRSPVRMSAAFSLAAFAIDPQGRQYLSKTSLSLPFVLSMISYIGGAAALGYGFKFLFSKRAST